MVVVRTKGKPSLFITITCNENWPEIQRELLPDQHAIDRPDMVSRVFAMKYEALLRDLRFNEIFGKVDAMCHVTEFQKRGLPLGHILAILADDDKLHSADDYDSVVRAWSKYQSCATWHCE